MTPAWSPESIPVPTWKARFGANYFLYVSLTTFIGHSGTRPPRMLVTAGGETVAGVTAIVQNGEHYTYYQDRPVEAAIGGGLDSAGLAGLVLERADAIERSVDPHPGAAHHGCAWWIARGSMGTRCLAELELRSANSCRCTLTAELLLGEVTERALRSTPGSLERHLLIGGHAVRGDRDTRGDAGGEPGDGGTGEPRGSVETQRFRELSADRVTPSSESCCARAHVMARWAVRGRAGGGFERTAALDRQKLSEPGARYTGHLQAK